MFVIAIEMRYVNVGVIMILQYFCISHNVGEYENKTGLSIVYCFFTITTDSAVASHKTMSYVLNNFHSEKLIEA